MKVRDLLGAIRSNTVIEVEYRSGNCRICTGPSDNHELDKAFGDREVDNWAAFGGLFCGIIVDMVPQGEEADDAAD